MTALMTDHYLRFETVGEVRETAGGVVADLHGEQLRVDLVRPDIVRFAISRGGVFDESPTFAVCVDPLAEPVERDVEWDSEAVRLRTSALVVTVGLHPFRLDVHRLDGSAVIESAFAESAFAESRLTAGRATEASWAYGTLNDAFTVRRRCRREDAVFGLGEKAGRHNRKGRDFTLWNNDVLDTSSAKVFGAEYPEGHPRADMTSVEYDPYYISVPFFYHQAAVTGAMSASFVDNGYRGHYDFTADDEYRIHFAGGQYVEYVFAGPDMPTILEQYTWLTGRTAPPPLWSLGYHQCRWFAYTQDAVESLASRHRLDEIPCDAMWLDIEYMDGYRVFTWDNALFPDPAAMLKRLRDNGFRVITIIDPGVKYDPGYAVFDQAVERDVLCRTEGGGLYIGQVWPGNTAFPDFVTAEARAWWGELNAAHVKSGLAGIWNDMNEPATGSIPADRMRFGRGEYSHERYHNQYALLMAMGTTEGLLDAMPGLRTFVLSRAGSAGIQRYAANWMGDNMSRWDHLWVSMPMAAGLGLSGQSFVGADIGGFAGHSNGELFLRWMQYGALTPFCRNHSEIGNVDQYAWSWGAVIEDLVREAVKLRYRLLPYIYASFLRATETGAPVQRPLVFDHQYDATTVDIDDEYLLGPDLLVAPVISAGQTSRQVYLPAGAWYDWYSGEALGGNRFVQVDTPVDRIPLYARGGAVIPMWPMAPASTADYRPSVIELHVFVPTTDGSWTSFLQEDDGLTFAALSGARYRTTFQLSRTGAQVRLVASVEGDGYPEFARTEFRVVLHGVTVLEVTVNGVSAPVDNGSATVGNAGTGFTLEF